MKKTVWSSRCAALPLLAFTPCISLAENVPALGTVVVTATRVEQPLTDVVADVSIIDREVIERSGALGIADLLSRIPGVTFSRNGGPGATTSVYVRGSETRFTPVYIDGVRVDSQSTGGATWNAIPLSQIDRIEVVRGPAAAVYGSDALGGVVQIFTRRGDGPFTPSVLAGAGTHGTRNYEASVRGRQGAFDYSLGLSRESSNPDLDGYRRQAASTSLGWQINPVHRLDATAMVSDLNAQYDAFRAGRDDIAQSDLRTFGVNWLAKWTSAYSTRLSVTRGEDRYETLPSPYLTETQVTSYLLHNEWRQGSYIFSADLERREDRLENASTLPEVTERFQNGVGLGYGYVAGKHTLQLNARRDADSEFGGKTSGSVAYAYGFLPGWKARASVGTAFRVPTLFQRFSIYGVPTLRAETARNREVGLSYAKAGSSFSVVAYRNQIENLITFVSGPGTCPNGTVQFAGCYANTARAELTGVTLVAEQRVGRVAFSGSLDFLDPRDEDTGNILPRRARRFGTVAALTRIGTWTTGAELQFAGERFNNAANTQPLPGYGLLNLHARTPIARDWSFLARIDNVGDKDYQTALGYNTPGRLFYVALQWEPAR
jgi:vitamin B12 transporter